MHTIADTLRHFAPLVPEALVPPDAMARAARAASHLPAGLSNWLYLECRLRANDSRVDLALNVDRRGRDVLAGRSAPPAAALGDAVRAHPAWARVGDLARRWADPASAIARAVESVWLEFDLDRHGGDDDDVPVPGVFVDFVETAIGGDDGGDGGAAAEAGTRLAGEALAPLLGGPLPDAAARRLHSCFAALPSGAFVIYLGVMLSRPAAAAAVRLCVMGVEGRRALASFLRAAEWPGPADDVIELAAALAHADNGAGAAMVHLDVMPGGGVAPVLGLEFTFTRRPQLDGRIAERGLLDALVARRLCDPAKRDALAGWPGYHIGTLPHELWPSLVIRRLNHVKVVCTPDGMVDAKAYLCFHHEYRSRRWTPGSIQ